MSSKTNGDGNVFSGDREQLQQTNATGRLNNELQAAMKLCEADDPG